MAKKIYIQLFLIFIFLIISLFLFLKYFKKTSFENKTNANISQTINTSESLIEDLKYLSTDKEGNEYKIEAKKGNIDNKEMLKVFNCGIGMVLIVNKKDSEKIIHELKKIKLISFLIGKIINKTEKKSVVYLNI